MEKQPKQNIALGEAAAVVEEALEAKKKDFSWSCKKERCYFRTSTSGSANSVEVVALASMAKVEAAL